MNSKLQTVSSSLSDLSSEPTRSNRSGFLRLSETTRRNIYHRILRVPHPIYIFQEPNCRVEAFAPERPARWLALLHVNRQIHREASAALYGINQFHLMDITHQQFDLLESFLGGIGLMNAASLSHLCINFPAIEFSKHSGFRRNPKLGDVDLQTLNLLRNECTSLSTLEVLLHSKNCAIFKETDNVLQEALLLMDGQFKLIPSLDTIVVQVAVCEGVPTDSAKEFMRGLAWKVASSGKSNSSG